MLNGTNGDDETIMGLTIDVVKWGSEHATAWKQFLLTSNNGTLFHDLDFLAYHPPDRFETHHLLFCRNGEVLALLPGAIVRDGHGRRSLQSPYGASVGGFVLPMRQSAEITLALVERLKAYGCEAGLDGIELRLAPSIYMQQPDEQLSFALAVRGFRLVRRWLTHVIPLAQGAEAIFRMFSRRKMRYRRGAERQGVVLQEAGGEALDDFYGLLCRNLTKYATLPTHTLADLQFLFERIPQSLRLFLSRLGETVVGGALAFELNPCVALIFYVCHEPLYEALQLRLLLVMHVASHYAERRFRYLDLGPSTFDDFSLNQGAASFKEALGAKGFCRDTWRWEREGNRPRGPACGSDSGGMRKNQDTAGGKEGHRGR